MTKEAKIYLAAVIAPGLASLIWAALHWSSANPGAYAVYVVIAIVLGITRIKLPGLVGTYSMSFVPVLYGLNHLSSAEVLVAAALSAVAGCVVKPKKRPTPVQVLFNSANLILSAGSCLLVYGFLAERIPYLPILMCVMVALYFSVNTFLVSGILSLVQNKAFFTVCEAWYFWSFVYYLAGAAAMGLAMSPTAGVQSWLVLAPIAYLMYFFWRLRTKPAGEQNFKVANSFSMAAKVFVNIVVLTGGSLVVYGLLQWLAFDPLRFAITMVCAALASCCKVKLPGMVGNISTSFVVILFAASEMQLGETMAIAIVAAVTQSYWMAKRKPRPVQLAFNVATMAISAAAAFFTCHLVAPLFGPEVGLIPALLASTAVFYALDTALVSTVLGLIEERNFASIWETCRFWSLPYYLVGTAATGIMVAGSRTAGYYAPFLVLTVMSLVFLAYRAHVNEAQLREVPANC